MRGCKTLWVYPAMIAMLAGAMVCVGQQTLKAYPQLQPAGTAAQTPAQVPVPTQAVEPASTETATPVETPTPVQAPATVPVPVPAQAPVVARVQAPVQTRAEAKKGKLKKAAYAGPETIVELPPTPMLDEEGKQRLDPDGKPMFNPPVKQQRDKKGHPLFDEHGKPVMQTASELGYDEHGKKLHVKKEKPPKMTPVSIKRGTFTVDGVIGKAALNYDIPDLKYIYLYAPGIGIAVVSKEPFPGAKEQAKAFDDTSLTVTVGNHTLQLSSDTRLLGNKPEPAYVLVDRDFTVPSRFPVVGYGTIRQPPYSWPGAKPNAPLAGVVQPPPVPVDLRPTLLLKPCPAGQMRRTAPPVLPGQVAPDQPCVAITKVVPVTISR